MNSPERHNGLVFSALIHVLWLILTIFGLPLLTSKPLEEPAAISVEILPITGITNVKPADKPTPGEDKPEEKKVEPKKPTPPVKTAEDTPPPPPETKIPDPTKPKIEDKKKPEEKKEDKKKSTEDDLAAVLKAVKDTAKQQNKDDTKDASKDHDKNKSKSNQYNNSLPMSMSEKDAVMSQLAQCWNVPAGAKDAQDLSILINAEYGEDGSLIKVELSRQSASRYNSDTFFRAAADSALRAVRQCSPLKGLPPEKYGTWREMELNFDPKLMLN